MIKPIAIAMGGAAGCLCRYYIAFGFGLLFGKSYPYGILFVNVLGSFLIGICAAYSFEFLKGPTYDLFTLLVIVGFLGGFTTFSSFSLDTFTMLYDHRILVAFVNVMASLVLCVLATGVGFYLVTKVA